MLLAARIDDGDRRPQVVPPHPRVPVVERSWAQAHLYLGLSESGSGDNNPGSFSGWPGDESPVGDNVRVARYTAGKCSLLPFG